MLNNTCSDTLEDEIKFGGKIKVMKRHGLLDIVCNHHDEVRILVNNVFVYLSQYRLL